GKKLYERLLVGDAVSGVPHIEGHDPNNVGANYVRPSLKEDIVFPLPPHIVGEFNLENAAIAYNICKTLGLSEEQIIEGFANFKGVNGRMEVVHDGDFKVIIDYAHTPDGLENILKTAREFTKGRLIILFGCGGNRDNKKRPIMGKVCASLADFCIVTSDNPRTENPEKIIEEIVVGMLPCKKTIITSRHDAIKYALENAKKDDCIILAGKGHEDYQIIGKEKIRFNEHEIVREILWKN
ncbi:MAG: UDP-N-acetylmuramyl-tripeptide synthetase, partial [Oscillospiraceae bacterium]|nr:UDP-N-acetylmuramyl-tripeptide synthetase [Oscillospiraceae bacterium]